MQLLSFVQVVARLADGRHSVGTGYRLRPDRVLTAGHVVEGAASIEIWTDRSGGETKSFSARCLWLRAAPDAGLDAAVLEHEAEPEAYVAFARLARHPLGRQARWESRGCARAAGEAGRTVAESMEPLSGRAFPHTEHEHLKLLVEGEPAAVDDWSGISGAPIVVGQRIIGIVCSARAEFEGRRLIATPMHRLLAEVGFAEAVGFEAAAKWEKQLDEIRKLLDTDRAAATALAEQRPEWRQAAAEGGARSLAAALGETAVHDVLLAGHLAHRTLGEQAAAEAAGTVEAVLAHVVPVIYDRQFVYSLPGEPGGVMLQVPVATPTVAEFVMAATDGRAYRFDPSPDGKTYPVPKAVVPKPPEQGIDFTGAGAFKDFVDHLASRFLDEESRQLVQPLPDEQRYEQIAVMVDDDLEWQAGPGLGLRHYFLFDSRFARRNEQLLVRLRNSLPALRLVELTSADVAGDRRLALPLRQLLYEAQNLGGS